MTVKSVFHFIDYNCCSGHKQGVFQSVFFIHGQYTYYPCVVIWSNLTDFKVLSLKNEVNLIRLATERISTDSSVVGKVKVFLNVWCGCMFSF